ncbi:hypothetical protein OJF2_67170 [Aquisphaera giovannonii]|uniref:Thioredoxin domain-containing protein n=1 Tax=Aquisphaera giovannonii TaxID=406548 RepID=A0A5B9WD09_9BACT|nr:hypothetical protein [Aquisphaera giovannonii]QEH38119.1 hypothetical protein OJF2_67170 [Aquisphaera giovannonii]
MSNDPGEHRTEPQPEAAPPEGDPGADDPSGVAGPRRRVDLVGLSMAAATVVMLCGAAWLRFGPAPADKIEVGSTFPPLRLLDLETEEARLLLGQRGRVLWVVFWSAGSPSGADLLKGLEPAWGRLRAHRGFTLAAAAVESDRPELVRRAVAASHASLPVYLAGPEARRRFSAGDADPPIHMLIDADGHIAVLSRGADRETIQQMAARAEGWLRQIDPLGNTRFAASHP